MLTALALLVAAQAPKPALNSTSFRLAADYSRDARGLSVLVMRRGEVLFEEYHHGHDADTPHMLASGTKSFVGILAVRAQEDGLLRLDERAADTLTEWTSDPQKSRITIRQILTLTSGLDKGTVGRPSSYADANQAPVRTAPGTTFQYGPTNFQVFGEILRRKLAAQRDARAMSVEGYLQIHILQPMGLNVARWTKDADGNPNLPSGAFLTAREWAKFGGLVLNKGKGVVSAKGLAQCFVGTKANPGYGLCWWLNRPGTRTPRDVDFGDRGQFFPGGPRDAVMAAGLGQQRLYVIPSLDLVIVRQGRMSRFRDSEFLTRLVYGRSALR